MVIVQGIGMLMFLAQATATSTPAAGSAFDTRPYIELLSSWQSLTFGMALLFVILFALLLGILAVWFIFRPRTQNSFNANETMRQQLLSQIADERKEKDDLARKADEREEKNTENWTSFADASNRIADQMKRTNDLIEANNKRGQERDETQKQLATAVTTMVNEGSKPLQEVAKEVSRILEIITSVDGHMATLDEINESLPKLQSGMSNLIGLLQSEAERRSTQTMTQVTEGTPT